MTYEYVCTSCGHGWEAEQSISAAPLTECPSCHAHSAKRQVSGGAGFILKGGGWYSDLYSSAPKKSGDSGSSDSSSSTTKESSSSDTSSSKAKSDSTSGSGTSGSGTSSSGTSGGSGSPTSGGKSSGASAA
jgi:putative FmdB family regulatory protein